MSARKKVAICSHRLGGTDGVSIEAAKWSGALSVLGFEVTTVAGAGNVDHLVPALKIDATSDEVETALRNRQLERAFHGADLVIVENVCSLKMNPAVSELVAETLADRPSLFHHHDLAIERPDRTHLGPPPNDAAWSHVCISKSAERRLAEVGISATALYNHFDPMPKIGDRQRTRQLLSVSPSEVLALQPTRAIARKAIPTALALCEAIGATYWILGDAEDGYEDELERIIHAARTRVIRQPTNAEITIHDAYGTCDFVTLPSTWEGFGNPAIESATHLRPLMIGDYPVAKELAEHGFQWFSPTEGQAISDFVANPQTDLIAHNASVAREFFSLDDLPARLGPIVELALQSRS